MHTAVSIGISLRKKQPLGIFEDVDNGATFAVEALLIPEDYIVFNPYTGEKVQLVSRRDWEAETVSKAHSEKED